MSANFFFVLASGSPRRREFLKLLDIPFIVAPQEIDETPRPAETPAALVQRLSRQKAAVVLPVLSTLRPPPTSAGAFEPLRQAVIIAADTVVVFGDKILGKPADTVQARQMLQALRRKSHQVYTSFTLAIPAAAALALSVPAADGQRDVFVTRLHQSRVWMRPYSDAEIGAYIASGDPLDKAGAYGIQNETFAPVARLEGCFASVMGLPLGELAAAMRELNLTVPPIAPLCANFTGHPCCQQ